MFKKLKICNCLIFAMSQTATFLYMSHIVCYFSLVIKKDLLFSTVFCFAGVLKTY